MKKIKSYFTLLLGLAFLLVGAIVNAAPASNTISWTWETTEDNQSRCVFVSQVETGEVVLFWGSGLSTEIIPVTTGNHVSPICHTYSDSGTYDVSIITFGEVYILDFSGQNVTALTDLFTPNLFALGLANNPNLPMTEIDINIRYLSNLKHLDLTNTIVEPETYNLFLNQLTGAVEIWTGFNLYLTTTQYGGCNVPNRDLGITARNFLVLEQGWNIVDGGQLDCPAQPSSSGGGGGGGYGLQKDVCPDNRDCSDSYYDGICGPCSLEERENQRQHGSAEIEYLFQNKELFAQEVARVKTTTSNEYSNELVEAYVFAKDLGITTKETIDEAKLGDNIIRSHTAKMMSNYAIKILKKPIDTQKECEFTDIKQESEEMKNYAKLACQLGLMGLNSDGTANTVFNPQGELSRGEFGTIISRLLRGDKYNGGKTYYEAHLNALKEAGIMTKIENPTMKELRARVMLMLMRSAN